nr:immunoglobulin light chain junction region [Macaca mulatta]
DYYCAIGHSSGNLIF